MIAERKRYAGNIFHAAFHRHAHGSGIMRVHGRIIAMIYTPYHKSWPTVLAKLIESQLYAVHGSSIARPYLCIAHIMTTLEPEIISGRKGTRKTGTCRFWRTD